MEDYKMNVIDGDITQVPSDALITAINSGGMWYGGIDGAILLAAGDQYHKQAADRMPLTNLDVVVAEGYAGSHDGQFDNVIFVVDDLQSPLSEVLYEGLWAAHYAGYEKVTIPTIRMGLMLGVVEKSVEEVVEQMTQGVKEFRDEYVDSMLRDITFVVYDDPTTKTRLESVFESL